MSEFTLTEFDKKHGLTSLMAALGDPKATMIFIHSIVKAFGNIHDEKALLMAEKKDIVCVASEIDKDFFKFLSSLGIGPNPRNIITALGKGQSNKEVVLSELLISRTDILEEIRKRVDSKNAVILHPFKSSENEFRLSDTLGRYLNTHVHVDGGNPGIVEYVNLKHNCKAKATELGLPIVEGETVRLSLDKNGRPDDLQKLEEKIRKTIKAFGKAIVRGAYGSSGSSIEIITDDGQALNEALERISGRNDNLIYLVEPMLDTVRSTNIIFHVGRGVEEMRCVSATDQILGKKLEFKGSIFPPEAEKIDDMINSAAEYSKWLRSKGYIGLVGFDFGEYVDSAEGKINYFLAEINPRVNASAYAKALMENLNRNQRKLGNPETEAFIAAKVETGVKCFGDLKKRVGNIFFKPEEGKGLVPYNIGSLENGMFNAVFFGKTISEVYSMYRDMTRKVSSNAQ
jgi:hypothetical protein